MEFYDEFGNYCGPDIRDESRPLEFGYGEEDYLVAQEDSNVAVILSEDKEYYKDASSVYNNCQTLTFDEDGQDISESLYKRSVNVQKEIPKTHNQQDTDFLMSIMSQPSLVRNIGIFGHFHHGKTTLLDAILSFSRDYGEDDKKIPNSNNSNNTKTNQSSRVSTKSVPKSALLETFQRKTYLLNFLDCPGHSNFFDELKVNIPLIDGALVVVDVVEGVMMNTERVIKECVLSNINICLVLTKMDRLILELKLPPQDAYYKLLQVIEEVNHLINLNINKISNKPIKKISPELGNVAFASGDHHWVFTLQSFSKQYLQKCNAKIDPDDFASRLWGDWYHDETTNAFTKSKPSSQSLRTFCSYVLEPLYKIYSTSLAGSSISGCQNEQQTTTTQNESLSQILSAYYGYPHGLVDMVVSCVPSPLSSSQLKVDNNNDNDNDDELMIKITKLYHSNHEVSSGMSVLALGRIFSGKIKVDERVKVHTNSQVASNEEIGIVDIDKINVFLKDSYVQIPYAIAGNWVLLSGVDMPIKKVATITNITSQKTPLISDQTSNQIQSIMKLAIEPLNPASLPQMVESLRSLSKLYPALITHVEDSGEHIIFAPGELYLDCLMHDLRNLYGKIEIKVADPSVQFNETVIENSKVKSTTETPNKQNNISILLEPLDTGLSQDIEDGTIDLLSNKNNVSNFFRQKYKWDVLASKSVWAFGPHSERGPNVLMNDTLISEDQDSSFYQVKNSVVQGFQWACREGPLCDEPLRNCKVKIMDASISKSFIHRGGGQIIPTVRRGVYSSFMSSAPRIMEPVYLVEIQTPADCIQAVYPVLMRRRGHIFQDNAKPGTPFFTLKAYLPVIDSFGFEVDIRSYSQGQIFCQQVFDHWSVVPGDPLDTNVIIHPLEPAPINVLARDFMIKTRRRKGLADDIVFENPLFGSHMFKCRGKMMV